MNRTIDLVIATGIASVLLALLIITAPTLNLGWPPNAIDGEHDFWGGLLVEMIGVAVEITLILFVLTRVEKVRWQPVRDKIVDTLDKSLDQEMWGLIDTLENIDDRLASGFSFKNSFDELAREAKVRRTELSDYLQHSNNAFTPEMSAMIADYMAHYSNTYLKSLNPEYIEDLDTGDEQTRRDKLHMQAVYSREGLFWMYVFVSSIFDQQTSKSHYETYEILVDRISKISNKVEPELPAQEDADVDSKE